MSMTKIGDQMPAFIEEDCELALFKAKWPQGFCCPRCGGHSFYRLASRSRRLYECRSCSHQTSLTVGTIMEGTRTPLVKWFQALFLMQTGISSKLLSEVIQVTYKTAWLMNHKLRFAIQVHDETRQLTGDIQLYGNFYARPAVSRLTDPLEERDQPAVVGASVDPETGEIADVKIKRMPAAGFNRRLFDIASFGSFFVAACLRRPRWRAAHRGRECVGSAWRDGARSHLAGSHRLVGADVRGNRAQASAGVSRRILLSGERASGRIRYAIVALQQYDHHHAQGARP